MEQKIQLANESRKAQYILRQLFKLQMRVCIAQGELKKCQSYFPSFKLALRDLFP